VLGKWCAIVHMDGVLNGKLPPQWWYAGMQVHGLRLLQECAHEALSVAVYLCHVWWAGLKYDVFVLQHVLEGMQDIFTPPVASPLLHVSLELDFDHLYEAFCGIECTLFSFQERMPCVGRMIIKKCHHIFVIMDAIDGVRLQVRVYDLEGAQSVCIIWRK
jgi:hypothetical protein